ncbi:sugar phosphate isomerase/epimerase [Stappia sp. F7233]|uniref:Sugar phosphate isomerase/epimerase n=2 Tax=Stappia albiluteola TaxID=2758565 RepID=A0A839ADT9_9HYPH|nr:sugar phosphate isomerase/epimerase [Stappia albiluteola]
MNLSEELSIQLYSLREYGDLERQLAALAEAGFRRVETIGSHLADAKGTRALLDRYGIGAPTGHVAMTDLRSRLDWVAEQAKIVGIEELYMPAVPVEERGLSAERWHAVGAELGEMAERMAGYDLALGYHNHHWELNPFDDGSTPLQHLFAGAGGSKLTFEADLAWLVRGDGDPIAWMEREKTRLTAIHIKDIAPTGSNIDQDGWADIGGGTLDWPNLIGEARARGARWMVLEHDKPKDPIGFAHNSRAYLLRHFG